MTARGRRTDRPEIDPNDMYEIAFLQMELQECFIQLERKDVVIKDNKETIDKLHKKVQNQVLMQDHLYKEFIHIEKEYKKDRKELVEVAERAQSELNDEKKRVEKSQKLIENMQGTFDKQKMEHKVIELTKENTLLEINLNKLSRKYTTLEEQEKLLKRNYQSFEKDFSDMEVACEKKINSLKEWKRNATYQLKVLHDQLREAQPAVEYELIQKDLEVQRKAVVDLTSRNGELQREKSELQNQSLADKEKILFNQELEEYKDDLEKEFHIIKSKLEGYDP